MHLGQKWGKKYPVVIKSWEDNWDKLSAYFDYPDEIRKMIHTTNVVEGMHRQIRKGTKTTGSFDNDMALLKLVYLSMRRDIQEVEQTLQALEFDRSTVMHYIRRAHASETNP